MIAIDLALAGIAVGAVAALAGLGVLVTYRTTGVFNIASGGMAMLVAYVLWQAVTVWHWPMGVAAPLALFVVGPAIGLAAEWAVFRPLRRRAASVAETLVASTGLLVLLLGLAVADLGFAGPAGRAVAGAVGADRPARRRDDRPQQPGPVADRHRGRARC